MAILAGVLFGFGIVGLGYLTRQGRAIPFYSTVLIVIALVYVLFAVMAGDVGVMRLEIAIAAGFIGVAVTGTRLPSRRWAVGLVVARLGLHGGVGLVHYPRCRYAAGPEWWGPFCAVVDVVVGIWTIGLAIQLPQRTFPPGEHAIQRPSAK